jgi:hypothetical protein
VSGRLSIGTVPRVKVTNAPRTRHGFAGTVLGEGGGLAPRPYRVGDRGDLT